jgi:hypothetical protein
MTTATTIDRVAQVREYFEKYDHAVGTTFTTTWCGRRVRLPYVAEVTQLEREYIREEYEGFELIITKSSWKYQEIFDNEGNPFRSPMVGTSEIAGRGKEQFNTEYVAFAWQIKDFYSEAEINSRYVFEFSIVNGIGISDSYEKTRKTAIKKLDTFKKIKDVLPRLIEIADERLTGVPYDEQSKYRPFNVLVGDEVFIQAHGRKRKGIVIGTTGSRFIVGYVTPSNHSDLKYKTLRLDNLWVKP